jgi:hypothetical protein
MIITDPVVMGIVSPSRFLIYTTEAVFAVGVIVAGKLWMRWMMRMEQTEPIHKAGEIE